MTANSSPQALGEDATEMDAEGYEGYGDVLRQLGHYEEALEAYGDAAELGGNVLGYGRLILSLKQALRTQPDALDLQLIIAKTCALQNKTQEAIAYVEQTCRRWPDTDLDVLIHILSEDTAFISLADHPKYKDLCQQLKMRRGKQSRFEEILHQATAALHQSDLRQAETILKDIQTLLPEAAQKLDIFERVVEQQKRAEALFQEARQSFERRDYRTAQLVLSQSLSLDLSHAEAKVLSGKIVEILTKEKHIDQFLRETRHLKNEGDLTAAYAKLNKARELALEHPPWLQEVDQLGAEIREVEAHRRHEQIRKQQQKEQERREQDFKNWISKTDHQLLQQDLKSAYQCLKEAAAIFKDHPDVQSRTVQWRQHSLEARKKQIHILLTEARSLEQMKAYGEALAKLEAIERLEPGLWDVKEIYGRVNAAHQRIVEGQKWMADALTFEELGQWNLAEASIRKARECLPEDPEIVQKYVAIINFQKERSAPSADPEQEKAAYEARKIEIELEQLTSRVQPLFEAVGKYRSQQPTVQKTSQQPEQRLVKYRKTEVVDDVRKLLGKSLQRWGFRTAHGEIKIKAVYEDALEFSEGLAAVKLNGRWGYIDTRGNMVIKYQFHEVESFINGKAFVRHGRKMGQIDKTGKWVHVH